MNQKSLFSLILLLFLWGCNKDEAKKEAIFQGLMIDYDINTPRPDVTVILKRFDALVYPFPDNYDGLIQDSSVTDENGNYYFKIDQNDKPLYKITISENGYLEKRQSPEVLAKVINYYSKNEDTILLGKAGYLKIDLVNIPDGFDSIYLNCNIEPYRLYPQLNDTTFLENYLYKDNNQVHVPWEIIDKPNDNVFDSVIQLIPLDTFSLHIEF